MIESLIVLLTISSSGSLSVWEIFIIFFFHFRFGDIIKSTERRNIDKLCNSLLTRKKLNTAPIVHGKQYEEVAVQKFETAFGVQVQKCGLFVYEEVPFLAATPDGLVGKEAIIEVKCPYTGRYSKISESQEFPFLETENSKLRLKRDSNYYFQVQGQLLITGRSYCYFIVYTFDDLIVEVIHADKDFAKFSMLPKLTLFYEKHYRKYIANTL